MFVHDYNGHAITQLTEVTRISKYEVPATYVNVTEMCKACGKLWGHYVELDSTKAYWEALSAEIGIPISALVISIKGGNDKQSQGTWTHPEIAIDCAQWVSVEFRIWANRALRKLISEQVQIELTPQEVVQPQLPTSTPDEISNIIDLVLSKTGIDPRLIAGAKLNAIIKQHPQHALALESAKSLLSIPVEEELITPKQLGEILADRTGETWSSQRVNKLLIEKGLQKKSPEGKNPAYLPTEQGEQFGSLVLETAKGRDKTIQHLRWFKKVLNALDIYKNKE